MRIAALAFGVLAGLVASLILALGGLDVSSVVAAPGDRQTQAIRFALLIIANLGIFSAALVLAAPMIGGILLLVGALAWIGAAVMLGHTTDYVLILPPALMLVASIFSVIAHFRRPARNDYDADVEIIEPLRGEDRFARRPEIEDEEPEVAMPSFGADPRNPRSQRARNDDADFRRSRNDDWNPRRRRPPPPRAKPSFRQLDEDDEPSGLSRFTLGVSSILSFGLYAGLAGAALLVVWSLRSGDGGNAPTAAAVETAAVSQAPSSEVNEVQLAPVLPAASEPNAEQPAEGPLSPLRVAGPAGNAITQPIAGPVAGPAAAEDNFGDVVMSDDPLAPPRLSGDAGLPFDETTVPSLEPSAEPIDLEPDAEQPVPPDQLEGEPLQADGAAIAGVVMPFTMTPQMAALRSAAGTGPTRVRVIETAPPSDNGL